MEMHNLSVQFIEEAYLSGAVTPVVQLTMQQIFYSIYGFSIDK
jgi:hypothetical protein